MQKLPSIGRLTEICQPLRQQKIINNSINLRNYKKERYSHGN